MDETDLALTGALQRDPRAPWSALADPLGVDAATLSRRWARLTTRGEAWVTCYPNLAPDGHLATAMVEVECAPGTTENVAEHLAADAHAVTVEIVNGSADLLLTVLAADLAMLTDYVVRRVGSVPGVLRTRTTPMLSPAREGSQWRLDSLDARQREAIADRAAAGRPAARDLARDRALILALGEDGRMPHAALAERTGIPVTTVRRRLTELLTSRRAVLRCDAAPPLTGWPLTALLYLDVAADELADTARTLALLPQTRLCAIALGRANLLLALVARQPADLPRLEAEVTRRGRSVRVLDRLLTLRTVKLMGRLLDTGGLARGHVPMDLWAEPG